jgi:ATP-dependent helicase HrpB
MDPLPIDAVLPRLVEALRASPCAVLRAPTGAGKTTRVPPALLDAGHAGDRQVVVLEPRRLAARAAARRIAAERGARLGDEVGFHVRFDRRASARTRILVVTEGLLVRTLQDDPFLEGIGAVVLDEFHERNLDTDLALALVAKVQREARPDLKLVVMSATFDTAEVARFLGDCPVVESEGRLYPVEVRWQPVDERRPIHEGLVPAVAQALEATAGDVLAFLPGVGEIRRAQAALEPLARRKDLALVALYGDLPMEEQDAALRRGARRKVVLATNVAETSVTVEGVTAVVDSGLARVLRFDPAVGLDRLELARIARASAEQRAGRAGRTEPGLCLRLWSQAEERSLRDREGPRDPPRRPGRAAAPAPGLRRARRARVPVARAARGGGPRPRRGAAAAPRCRRRERSDRDRTRDGADAGAPADRAAPPRGRAARVRARGRARGRAARRARPRAAGARAPCCAAHRLGRARARARARGFRE